MNTFILDHRGMSIAPPDLVDTDQHSTSSYSFDWVVEGTVRWRHSAGEHVLTPRGLLLIRPDMTETISYHGRRPTRIYFVRFRRAGVFADAQLPPEETWPAHRVLRDGDPIRPLLRHVVRLRDDDPEQRETASLALTLAVRMFVTGHQLKPKDDIPANLQTVMRHIRRVWADGNLRVIPLAELADAARISIRHLSGQFRHEFGIGPSAALELLRLSHAATLLTRADLTLGEVAKASGFADAYHLSHRFHPRYGMPPGKYRVDPAAPSPMSPVHAAGLGYIAEQLL